MGPIGSKRYVTTVCYDMQPDNGGEGGKPYVLLSLRVVEGPDTGRNLIKRGYLSPSARDITIKQLRALGWTGTKLSKAMAEGLGTRKASVRLKVTEYNGKIREEVDGIYEPKPRGTKNPIDDTGLDAFDALFEDAAGSITADMELGELNRAPSTLPAAVASNGANTQAAENPNNLGF